MRDQSFSKRRVRCWAVIAGTDSSYDVVQMTSEFALNTIPSASVSLALGRDVEDIEGDKKTVNASINEKFLFRKLIKVYASYEVGSQSAEINAEKSIPEFSNKIIFEGYISGFGFQRTSNAVVLTIAIEHWLSDLAASTMLSSSTHYGTPADLQRAALYWNPVTATSTSKGQSTITLNTWVVGFSEPAEIINDLWEGGIKKIFLKAAESDSLADLFDINSSCSTTEANILNNVSKNAISRMTSKNAPLSIRLGSPDIADVANNIANDLTSLYLENFVGQTMWDCLIACSGNYMFAVAPGINIAQVVPYCPTVSKTPAFKKIYDSQIDFISISGDCPRTVRGVSLIHTQDVGPLIDNKTGVAVAPPGKVPVVTGSYINSNTGCKGVVLFKHTPSWMGMDISNFAPPQKLDRPASTVNPPKPGEAANNISPVKKIEDFRGIRNSYAKAMYGNEVLKGRQGTISGPLRFDIGVGSLIEFELPVDYHSPDTATNRYFYGVVIRVSCVIDANSASSSTSFTVAHIRTHAEETADGFIIKDGHPIYSNSWFGSALDETLK